jgi:prepilin-type N-terminal cleavage/methylation domain-containing protein
MILSPSYFLASALHILMSEAAMATNRKKERGVTMLELVVVLVIGAVLVAMSIPSFIRTRYHLNIQGAAQGMVGDLRTTQANAIRQGTTTMLTFAGTDQTYQDFCNANSCVQTDGNNIVVPSISFNSRGYVSAPAVMPFTVTMKVCQTGETVMVEVQRTGRIQTLTASPSGC